MNLKDELKKRYERFYQRYFSITENNWFRYAKLFPLADRGMRNLAHPRFGKLLRTIAAFEGDEHRTQSHLVPINRDLTYRGKNRNRVLPIEKVRQVIQESGYRVIVKRCICRDGAGCNHYPRDLGCLMLGEGTRALVTRGIARYASIADALAHLEKAAELGLVAVCAWVEMEALVMGIPHKEHEQFLEICLCCPCCCLGFRNFKFMLKEPALQKRVRSTGWRASGTRGCKACGLCAEICPMEAITVDYDREKISVSDGCLGCGLCAVKCPARAIIMKAETTEQPHILDYFWGFRPRISG